jgi:hypothetical protein
MNETMSSTYIAPINMKYSVAKVVLLLVLSLSSLTASALTYYSRNNGGAWSAAATWSTDAVLQCAGAAAVSAPGAADDVVICTGFTVIWNGPTTTSINNLTILTGGVLTISINGTNIQLNSLQMEIVRTPPVRMVRLFIEVVVGPFQITVNPVQITTSSAAPGAETAAAPAHWSTASVDHVAAADQAPPLFLE